MANLTRMFQWQIKLGCLISRPWIESQDSQTELESESEKRSSPKGRSHFYLVSIELEQVTMGEEFSGSSTAIDSSNIGFKLLKKHGWKEGTGLGVCEQGRLEPIRTCLKNNKRGLGAEKAKKKVSKPLEAPNLECKNDKKEQIPPKKSKASKKMRKMQELEKQLLETEFERAFRREFWPDNV